MSETKRQNTENFKRRIFIMIFGNIFLGMGISIFKLSEFFTGKKYIGVGTFFNAICLGYIATFFYEIWIKIFYLDFNLIARLLIVCIGVIVVSFGLALYQTSDVGVAPYDSLALILAERFPKISYFAFRIFADSVCALICFLSGGVMGIGMIVCALGLGPVVQFFSRTVAIPMIYGRKKVNENNRRKMEEKIAEK